MWRYSYNDSLVRKSPTLTLDELLRNRQRLFWILNIGGWAGYAVTTWLGALAHEKPES